LKAHELRSPNHGERAAVQPIQGLRPYSSSYY
jgi:hypothetical protein